MTHEIKNHWVIHPLPTDRPISLRAIKPKGLQQPLFPQNRTYHPADYESSEDLKAAFERDVLQLNDIGLNVYAVMNMIRDDFRGGVAVRDLDITHRTTVLIDIDRVDVTSRPASDSEINAAFDLASNVASFLDTEGLHNPQWVHSGNGAHLYYRISAIPQTQEITQDVERFLKGLAKKFNNGIVGIDTSVYNASRITKVIGTIARKGVESEARPYRMARLV